MTSALLLFSTSRLDTFRLSKPRSDAVAVEFLSLGATLPASLAHQHSVSLERKAWASSTLFAMDRRTVMAILTRRTLIVTRAPILSSLRRMVPQVTLANWVDSKDDSARRFYERERFLPFPDQPRKLFRPIGNCEQQQYVAFGNNGTEVILRGWKRDG